MGANQNRLPIKHKNLNTVGGNFSFRDHTQPKPPPPMASPFSSNPIPHNLRNPYTTGLDKQYNIPVDMFGNNVYSGMPIAVPVVIQQGGNQNESASISQILKKLDVLSAEMAFIRSYVAKTGAKIRSLEGEPLTPEQEQTIDVEYQQSLQKWQAIANSV